MWDSHSENGEMNLASCPTTLYAYVNTCVHVPVYNTHVNMHTHTKINK